MDLFQALMKEQEQYLGLLGQLKDYDEMLTQELAAKAYQEQERQKLEVKFTSLGQIYNICVITVKCYYHFSKLILENYCLSSTLKTVISDDTN